MADNIEDSNRESLMDINEMNADNVNNDIRRGNEVYHEESWYSFNGALPSSHNAAHNFVGNSLYYQNMGLNYYQSHVMVSAYNYQNINPSNGHDSIDYSRIAAISRNFIPTNHNRNFSSAIQELEKYARRIQDRDNQLKALIMDHDEETNDSENTEVDR